MILTKIFLLTVIVVVLFSCNKIDNYNAPNGTIYGNLNDNITKEPIQSEEPNGFTIKLFEKGKSVNAPISFQGKPDGTFENAWIFQNEYKVLPTDGAFFPVDTVTLKVGSHTEVNFDVTPYLGILNANVSVSSGKVTTNYMIERSKVGDKISERKTLVSSIPTVNNVVFNFKSETDLSGITDDAILASQFTDVVSGLTSGGKYYVRIAVRTNNGLKKYNYSKIFPVTIP